MKKTDIVDIAIKILGLYLFTNVIYSFINSVETIFFLFTADNSNSMPDNDKTIMIVAGFLQFTITLSFAIFMVFGSKIITHKICSKADYDENAKLFAEKRNIFEMAIIIIGGILFIFALPEFLTQLLFYIESNQQGSYDARFQDRFLYASIAKIIIGFLLINFNKALSGILVKEKKEKQV